MFLVVFTCPKSGNFRKPYYISIRTETPAWTFQIPFLCVLNRLNVSWLWHTVLFSNTSTVRFLSTNLKYSSKSQNCQVSGQCSVMFLVVFMWPKSGNFRKQYYISIRTETPATYWHRFWTFSQFLPLLHVLNRLHVSWQFCLPLKGVGERGGSWDNQCDLPGSPGKPWVAFSSSLENTILLLEGWAQWDTGRPCSKPIKTTKRRIKRTNKKTKGFFVYFISFGPPESPVKKHQTSFTVCWSSVLGGFPNKTVN